MDRFPSNSALLSKNVCYKVSCLKAVSDKVVRHSFPHLSVQNGWWGRPLLREYLAETNPPPSKTPISNQYSLVATQP